MKLIVDHKQRYAKMRAHTATHLLHAALLKIFPTTKQAGSHVDQDYLRFDFQADKALTPQQMKQVEQEINTYIYDAYEVTTEEKPFKEATKMGAKAFFEDKYGDTVRVVSVCQYKNDNSEHNHEYISLELCGGTHVTNTKDIGAFAILNQEAVASGIKRIIAVTGPKVQELVQQKEETLENLGAKLGVNSKQVGEKLEKFVKEHKKLEEEHDARLIKLIGPSLQHKYDQSQGDEKEIFDKIIPIQDDPDLEETNFKRITELARKLGDKTLLVYNNHANFMIYSPRPDKGAKNIAQGLGLKGGGSEEFFQGRDEKVKSIIEKSITEKPQINVSELIFKDEDDIEKYTNIVESEITF